MGMDAATNLVVAVGKPLAFTLVRTSVQLAAWSAATATALAVVGVIEDQRIILGPIALAEKAGFKSSSAHIASTWASLEVCLELLDDHLGLLDAASQVFVGLSGVLLAKRCHTLLKTLNLSAVVTVLFDVFFGGGTSSEEFGLTVS